MRTPIYYQTDEYYMGENDELLISFEFSAEYEDTSNYDYFNGHGPSAEIYNRQVYIRKVSLYCSELDEYFDITDKCDKNQLAYIKDYIDDIALDKALNL